MWEVQTVLIPRTFSLEQAIKWLNKNGYENKKVDITENYYRFRQNNPKKSTRYYTLKRSKGIQVVYQEY